MSDVLSPPDFARDASVGAPPVRVYVCTMCNDRRRGSGGLQAGRYLYNDLAAGSRDPRVEVIPIECLSVCRAAITMSFTADGKWSHVFVVPSNTDVAEILEGARLYASSRTGLFPWRRCASLQKGVVARVPPVSPSRDGAH